MIRKHFFNKKKNKLDLVFLTKIVNMQDKLEQFLPQNQTIGDKYFENARNLWFNDYLDNYKTVLAGAGIVPEKG